MGFSLTLVSQSAGAWNLTRRDLLRQGGTLAGILVAGPLIGCGSGPRSERGTLINEIVNPRPAASLQNWAALVPGGATPALGLAPQGADGLRGSAELAFAPGERGAGAILPAAPSPVEVGPGTIVWGQVAALSSVNGAALRLSVIYRAKGGAPVGEATLARVDEVPSGRWLTLRGFDAAPAGAAACHLAVWLEEVRAPARLRATNALIALDPAGMPRYFDGDSPKASWLGEPGASASEGPAPGPATPARRDFAFGFNDNASQTSFLPAQTDVDLHREVGSRLLCMTVNLASPEFQRRSGGRIEWSAEYPARHDAVYRACRRAGVALVPIPLFCPPWMGVAQGAPPPAGRVADWAELCAQLAERWPEIPAIQVWNEPNLGRYFWKPRPDPARYVDLLSQTTARVRREVPGVALLSGGLSGIPEGDDHSTALGPYLEGMYAAGARGTFDGLAFHPYPAIPGTGRNFDTALRTVTAVQRRHRDPRPWWITETGVSSGRGNAGANPVVDERRQAIVNRLLVALLKERPEVRAACIHTLISSAALPRGHFEAGYEVVERGTLRRKAAFGALRAESGDA